MELQQTIQDLQQNTENQSVQVEESQDETVQEELTENSDEQIEDSDESEVDQIMQEEAMLLESYSWLENSEAVEELQKLLGIEADGWYGAVTREAHLAALEEKGFSRRRCS
ncbi:MAG: hypothetical protein ACJZ2F_00800 [Acidimicrobiales bacterium]